MPQYDNVSKKEATMHNKRTKNVDYLEEMNTFLKTYNLLRLNYEVKYLNRTVTSMEIESVIKTYHPSDIS